MEYHCPKCGYANSNRSDISCAKCGYVWDTIAYESLTKKQEDPAKISRSPHKAKNNPVTANPYFSERKTRAYEKALLFMKVLTPLWSVLSVCLIGLNGMLINDAVKVIGNYEGFIMIAVKVAGIFWNVVAIILLLWLLLILKMFFDEVIPEKFKLEKKLRKISLTALKVAAAELVTKIIAFFVLLNSDSPMSIYSVLFSFSLVFGVVILLISLALQAFAKNQMRIDDTE